MRSRLHSVAIGVGAAALAVACASSAGAQDYPSQRIAFVVGLQPGDLPILSRVLSAIT